MKCLLFLLLTGACFSADAQRFEKMFDMANEFYHEQEYDSAFLLYEKIYKSGKAGETFSAKSFYNMGHIYMLKEDYKNAKKIFESILDSDYDEMDKGGRGSGIMAEPYALYKNNCCKNLAEIALLEKRYQDALDYTRLTETEYPYIHFCGNEYAANDIYIAYTVARCYEGLEMEEKAIKVLIPFCMYNGLASNKYLVEMACRLIKKKYSATEIKIALEKATAEISSKKTGYGRYKSIQFYTNLFGTNMFLYGTNEDWRTEKVPPKLNKDEYYRYYFLQSNFYKTLVQ